MGSYGQLWLLLSKKSELRTWIHSWKAEQSVRVNGHIYCNINVHTVFILYKVDMQLFYHIYHLTYITAYDIDIYLIW